MNDTRHIANVNLGMPQATHRAMCEALCCDLRDAVKSGSLDGDGTGSIRCRACVVLYLLLCDHPLDQQGRCQSCRRSGAVLGQQRRTCHIHAKANFWLRQPDAVVLRHLANELNYRPAPVRVTGGRPDRCSTTQAAATHGVDATEVLPRIPDEPCTQSIPTMAVPTPPRHPGGGPPTGRPDPDHGSTGEHPESLRSRRAPLDDRSPHTGQTRYVELSRHRTEGAPGEDW